MSLATTLSSKRVRQIAILISSVDAVAARQLLLHLPTELAKQVRTLAAELGDVSPAERRAVVAEFQQASGQAQSEPSVPSETPAGAIWSEASDACFEEGGNASRSGLRSPGNVPHGRAKMDKSPVPAWTKLSTEALLRFVRGERVAVVAVVISQLDPHQAVAVLRQLPREVSHAVIQRLSHLQDIDPDATAAIDEHLAERLSEYQHRIESECENTRRLSALLAAAPQELQQEWSQALHGPVSHEQSAGQPAQTVVRPLPLVQPTIAELYGDAVYTTQDNFPNPVEVLSLAGEHGEPVSQTQPDVIPFPTPDASTRESEQPLPSIDRVKLQRDFEQVLELSRHDLASLLTSVDSPTVLLALAGSSPEFMQRFTKLLKPQDAKVLSQRMQQIGKIRLRDVDQAQRKIVDQARVMLDRHLQRGRFAA